MIRRIAAAAAILLVAATTAVAGGTPDDPYDQNDLPIHGVNAGLLGWPHKATPAEVRELTEWVARESYGYAGMDASVSCAAVRPGLSRLYVCRTRWAGATARALVRVWEDGSALMVVPGKRWDRKPIRTSGLRLTVYVRNGKIVGAVA